MPYIDFPLTSDACIELYVDFDTLALAIGVKDRVVKDRQSLAAAMTELARRKAHGFRVAMHVPKYPNLSKPGSVRLPEQTFKAGKIEEMLTQ